MPRLSQQAVADAATGTRYALKGGLRTPELLLLQRAINMYVRAYGDMKAASKLQAEKDEDQAYIDAACALSKRLTHELEQIDETPSQKRS